MAAKYIRKQSIKALISRWEVNKGGCVKVARWGAKTNANGFGAAVSRLYGITKLW